jgi:exosortase
VTHQAEGQKSTLQPCSIRNYLLAIAAVLLGVTCWAYGATFVELARRWSGDPQYSHGYLVPLFAAWLLWERRGLLSGRKNEPAWWGFPLLLAGAVLRLVGGGFYLTWVSEVSLLLVLAGIVTIVGGKSALRWAWPGIAFLAFMIPLPGRLNTTLGGPLQRVGTTASTYLLQLLGFPAVAEGNVILLNEVELGIVEACSGLRMLVIFFALATAFALLLRRPLVIRLLLVLSAAPIAVIANVVRITATGVLHETVGSEVANLVFHDLAGWLMMLFALGLLGLELLVLQRLIVVTDPATAKEQSLMPAAFGLSNAFVPNGKDPGPKKGAPDKASNVQFTRT